MLYPVTSTQISELDMKAIDLKILNATSHSS